ncbi:Ionotropic receptor 572 [Blattella germanica]|nr:Ionotropic receptor 572 [Blattella germanica]
MSSAKRVLVGIWFLFLRDLNSELLPQTENSMTTNYNIVQCILNICSNGIQSDVTLTIVLPFRKYYDEMCSLTNRIHFNTCYVTDSVLSKLYSSEKWNFLVTSSEYNSEYNSTFEQPSVQCYFIVTGETLTENTSSVFSTQLQSISRNMWNPRAKFIVLVSTSINTTVNRSTVDNVFISDIMTQLFSQNVVNAILVVPIVSSDPEKVYNLRDIEIHSWFPFTEDHCRGSVKSTVILNTWDKTVQKFNKNTNLFPDKLLDLHGCVVKASTFPYSPHVFSNNAGNESGVTDYKDGLEIRIFHLLSEAMNFKVHYLPAPKTVLPWYDVRDHVKNGFSDLCFAGFIHVQEHLGIYDSTTSHTTDTLKFFRPLPQETPHWKSLIIIFPSLLWLYILIAYFIGSFIFWVLANIQKSIKEHFTYTNWMLCFMQTFSVILGEAVAVRPATWYLRVLFLFWVFYCLVINTAFQSALIDVLTNPRLEAIVTSLDELLKSKLKFGFLIGTDYFYKMNDDPVSKYLVKHQVNCEVFDKCVRRMISKKDLVLCGGELNMVYLSKTSYSKLGEPQFHPFQETVITSHLTFVLRLGSIFLERFDKLLFRMIEGGFVVKIWDDIKMTNLELEEEDSREFDGHSHHHQGPKSLDLDHLQAAFSLAIIGLLAGIAAFLLELMYFTFRRCATSDNRSSAMSEMKVRSKTNYKNHFIYRTNVKNVNKR